MENLLILLGTLPLFFLTPIQSEDDIIGQWKAPDIENAVIKIYKHHDGFFYGKIKSADTEAWVGETILKKLNYSATDQIWKGKLYSPKRKVMVNVTIKLETANTLKLTGKKLMITKTFYWKRLKKESTPH